MKSFTEALNWLRGHDEKIANAIKDPVLNGRLAIQDAKSEVNGFISEIAKLIAGTKDLQHRRADAAADVAKYENIAKMAGAKSDRQSVSEALELKKAADGRMSAFDLQIQTNKSLEERLRSQLADLQKKIDNAQNHEVVLEATISSSKLRKSTAQNTAGVGNGKGFAALSDLERDAQKAQADAEAWEDIAGSTPASKGEALEKKYGADNSVSDKEIDNYISKATVA